MIKPSNYICLPIIMFFLSCQPNQMILYKNCNIYNNPNINAILCQNGKIVKLFSPDGQAPTSGIQEEIDLKGGWVYPGFIDSHMHLRGLGWSLESVDMVGTLSKDLALEKVRDAVKNTPEGTWVRGRGWDQNDWKEHDYPSAKDLDAISETHPMVFRRIDGHAAWANSLAIKLAGISKETENVDGGFILRDDHGEPTGIFIDNALDLIESKIPEPDSNDIKRQIKLAQTLLNRLGVTAVHDAGTSMNEISILKEMIVNNELTIRVYAMLNNDPIDYEPFLVSGPETDNPFLQVRAIKIFMDGSLGSRGAALLEPYTDDLENSGLLLLPLREHEILVKRFSQAGFQTNTHGIGDRAVRRILDSYEKNADPSLRNRIEHAQIVHPLDIPRFQNLNVIPAMQATHCTSDMYWADERLGEERLIEAYPWRSLIESGVPVPGGSDAPVEFPDPLEGIYAATTRKDKNEWPENGWQPKEKMTLDMAIKSYTEWPSYASFEEGIKGKIVEGFYADFTVLDQPLTEHNIKMVLETSVTFTIINGKVVFKK